LIIPCPSQNGAVDKEFLAAMRGKIGKCKNALALLFIMIYRAQCQPAESTPREFCRRNRR
jgi:hypothetical protein